jgi:type IV secretion system protein VirB6
MAVTLFQTAMPKIEAALTTFIVNGSTSLITALNPVFTSMLIIWLTIWGYQALFGKTEGMLEDSFRRILLVGFITSLALTVGTYMSVVVPFLRGSPEYLASILIGSPTASVASTLDTLTDKVLVLAELAWDAGGFTDIGLTVIAAAILIAGGILVFITASLVLFSSVLTTILLALGPLFIMMLLFQTTKQFFEKWLSALINAAFILILASVIGSLLLSIADSFIGLTSTAQPPEIGDAFYIVIIFSLLIYFLKQVPELAMAIAGGIALATRGSIGSAMNAIRPASIQRQAYKVKRDAQAVRRGAELTGKGIAGAAVLANRAYQKTFRQNTVSGS